MEDLHILEQLLRLSIVSGLDFLVIYKVLFTRSVAVQLEPIPVQGEVFLAAANISDSHGVDFCGTVVCLWAIHVSGVRW
jgi:hypothetical protein